MAWPPGRSSFRLFLAVAAVGAVAASAVPAAERAGDIPAGRIPGIQNEATIAVDPSDDDVLLGGSNSFREGTMRVYGSTDGGASWTTSYLYPPPKSYVASCASDPAVAIDGRGRQYFAFIRTTPCRTGKPRLYVSSRQGPTAAWSTSVNVSPLPKTALIDDKPAIAIGNGRVYVAWSRLSIATSFDILLSSSRDGGRTWSRPARVNRTPAQLTYASVAVSGSGIVYVAWDDASTYSLRIARSTDGGAHFEPERKVASFSIIPIPHCGSGTVIAAQLLTCIHANPIVTIDRSGGQRAGRVYVSYVRTNVTGVQGIYVTSFDRSLRLVSGSPTSPPRNQVAPATTASDRFWPQSAIDQSNGTLWICFYDTIGDPQRRRVFYSCTASPDGGTTWRKPVRAASVASGVMRPKAEPPQYGDYEGLAVANGVAHPMWTDARDRTTLEDIYTARLTFSELR